MEFDLTTFILEAINFLVLVWLLKHFFYRPVLAVIERRQAETARTIAGAEAVRSEAEALKSQYQEHLAETDRERVAAMARIDAEVDAERARRLAALSEELADERKRREVLETREQSEREAALERQAMEIAVRFATHLLERLAGPELNEKLADLTVNELDAQTGDKLEALRAALRDPGTGIKVVSAYTLDSARRDAFTLALNRVADRSLHVEFSEDEVLKAGVCIMAGSWVLMANLRDELGFFAGTIDHGR